MSFSFFITSSYGSGAGWDIELLPRFVLMSRDGQVTVMFRWLCWGFGFCVYNGE